MLSVVNLSEASEGHRLLERNKVARTGRAIPINLDLTIQHLMTLFDLSAVPQLLIRFSEGTPCTSSARLLKKGIRHDGLPLISHESDMRTSIANWMIGETDSCNELSRHNDQGIDLNRYFHLLCERCIELMFQLLCVLPQEVSRHMIVVRFAPPRMLFLTLDPNLLNGIDHDLYV